MTSTSPPPTEIAWVVLGRRGDSAVAVELARDGGEAERHELALEDLLAWVQQREARSSVRWVWHDTQHWYDRMLAAGVRVSRAHDLRLVHAILRNARDVQDDVGLREAVRWEAASSLSEPDGAALFELVDASDRGVPQEADEALREFSRQRRLLERTDSARLRLLAAAESAGALVASEMRAAGLPWDVGVHRHILTAALGPVGPDGLPARISALAREIRGHLGDPALSIDSQPRLLRALHRVGVPVESTGRWDLVRHEHPVIAPLLEYKKLMRLHTANGAAWLAEWVHDGRFRPVYVPAGVVTGRWASSGGGALQIPRQLRPAVRADPEWCLVVADVAQLEPRVLAAMAGDTRLAAAARGQDLYEGIVRTGAVASREQAKVAMLGAMYGATTGESGRLVPQLRRAFPRAMGLVDAAASDGEAGECVSTWLGRTSPAPSRDWSRLQSTASESGASDADEDRARRSARDRGRFTRNFVVQGTAAEWALAWLGDLRARLRAIEPSRSSAPALRSGPAFNRSAHLAFFLHDEIIVHAPAGQAAQVADAVREAAAAATRLMFGDFPIDFPLDLRISETAEKS